MEISHFKSEAMQHINVIPWCHFPLTYLSFSYLVDLTWGETLYIPEHRNPLNLETPIQFKVDTTIWETKTEQKHTHKPLFSLLNFQTKPAKKSAPNSSLGIVAFLTLMKQAREVKLARNKMQTCNVQEKAVLSLTTRLSMNLEADFPQEPWDKCRLPILDCLP